MKNRGTSFERELEKVFAAYRARGIADIEKVDAPTKTWGKKTIFLTNPWLDFVGSWTAGNGRMIQIEAKHTEEPRLPIISKSGGGLSEKQWEAARRWERAGAAVLLLWRFRDEVRVTTPLQAWAAAEERGRRSIRWADAHVMPQGDGWLLYDPLAWAASFMLRPLEQMGMIADYGTEEKTNTARPE